MALSRTRTISEIAKEPPGRPNMHARARHAVQFRILQVAKMHACSYNSNSAVLMSALVLKQRSYIDLFDWCTLEGREAHVSHLTRRRAPTAARVRVTVRSSGLEQQPKLPVSKLGEAAIAKLRPPSTRVILLDRSVHGKVGDGKAQRLCRRPCHSIGIE